MTDKERLERVEAMLHWADKYQEAGNGRLVDRTTNQIYQEFHIDWLIQQARGVQELEKQNKGYHEALEFYADESRYMYKSRSLSGHPSIIEDGGEKARKALEGEE